MARSRNTKPPLTNHTMRAFRQAESVDWVDGFAYRVWEDTGRAIAPDLSKGLRLTLIGAGEMTHVVRASNRLGKICMRRVAKAARRRAPETFQEPLELAPARLVNRHTDEGRVLAVAFDDPVTGEERVGLATGISTQEGLVLPFFDETIRAMKLPGVEASWDDDTLEAMFKHLPSVISFTRGMTETEELRLPETIES